jgi:hypothetical protein
MHSARRGSESSGELSRRVWPAANGHRRLLGYELGRGVARASAGDGELRRGAVHDAVCTVDEEEEVVVARGYRVQCKIDAAACCRY